MRDTVARFTDLIWHVRGSVALAPGQSADEVFARLDPVFRQHGTTHERAGETLTFTKKDQAAQDRMSIFDRGELRVEDDPGGRVLRYRLVSRALLFCFLLPFFFLAVAQLTIAIGWLQPKPTAAEKAKAEKKKAAEEAKPLPPMNPVDKFLGAPAPEKPKTKEEKAKEAAAKAKKDGKKAEDEEDEDKPSPTAAYVFAGIFALLYVVGRILEDRLIRSLFRKHLRGEPDKSLAIEAG